MHFPISSVLVATVITTLSIPNVSAQPISDINARSEGATLTLRDIEEPLARGFFADAKAAWKAGKQLYHTVKGDNTRESSGAPSRGHQNINIGGGGRNSQGKSRSNAGGRKTGKGRNKPRDVQYLEARSGNDGHPRNRGNAQYLEARFPPIYGAVYLTHPPTEQSNIRGQWTPSSGRAGFRRYDELD
ncbi:hypothetical protein C8Q75DRAFT_736451 [Abortiporus biennis]|nr:hypothetical protein C8Q75DRAFT_736451 [Abortiporus biennis]